MSERDVYEEFELRIDAKCSALMIIDMQYLDADRNCGLGAKAKQQGREAYYDYYFRQVEDVVVPNVKRLLNACRQAHMQIVYPRIASLLKDGRDVSLQHKRIGLLAAAGSHEAEILTELQPLENELVLSKGASGVFNSTAIDQLLRNMGINTLVVTGVITNECVETAVRDASDRGYNVVLVSDGCAALSESNQRFALEILNGVYCLVKSTDEVIGMVGG